MLIWIYQVIQVRYFDPTWFQVRANFEPTNIYSKENTLSSGWKVAETDKIMGVRGLAHQGAI